MKDDSLYSVEMLYFHPSLLLNLRFCSFFFTKVDILLLYFILWVILLMHFVVFYMLYKKTLMYYNLTFLSTLHLFLSLFSSFYYAFVCVKVGP